jgi:ABC-2 type transport system ATP-binding protein
MTATGPVIELESVSVAFGAQKVLDEVTLAFAGGSLGLLGPNGAGKSTLLKTLLGFIAPAGGAARVLGRDLRADPLGIRQRIGYMPERECHIPGMNAVTFVAYAGQLAGMQPKEAMQRAHEILYYVGLGEARYRNVETYSTGMKQRIKLAQALVHDPELVFLDEPTNGLDPKGRGEMLDLVRDIAHSKGIHVVLSSHLLPDVEWVCRDVFVINKGRRLASGPIEELKQRTGSIFECRLKGDTEGFRSELDMLGCRSVETEDGLLRIYMAEGLGSQSLVRVARDHRVQIRHLVPLRQSLEDVFMAAITRSESVSR